MKSHFDLRSLIFYTGSIGVVVILFTVATAYGEKNLQAPRRIDGSYPLTMQVPANCLKGKPVNLLLQQSGVFLTGALLPTDASEQATRIAQERPSLSGRWQNDELTLTGHLGRDWTCNDTVKITGSLNQNSLIGTLSLSSVPQPIEFRSDRVAPQPKPEGH